MWFGTHFGQCQQLINAFFPDGRFWYDCHCFYTQNLTCILTYFYKMTTTVPQILHTNPVTLFFTQITADRFCWLDWRHRGSMHELIDGGILGNMNLRVFSFPTLSACDTVRIQSVHLSQSTPDSLQPHGALELNSSISKLVFLVPRTTLLNLCRLKVPNGEPRICRDWPIASNNVSPFGSVSLACGFGVVRSLRPLGRNAFMDAWTWTLWGIRQYLCFLLCFHRPILKAHCHV